MTPCPPLAEIEAHLAGDRKEPLAEHLTGCASCAERLRELQRNLSLEARLRGMLEAEPRVPVPASADAPVAPAGYRLLGRLSEGGQGVVYRAIQESTRRTVAIKFLHQAAFPSARQRHRFEREIDMAGNLRHPGIVTIHESGLTSSGQHFYVMEFVDGVPIDEWVKSQALGNREVVALFQDVCLAVHHAHLHGVLHRDLKPNNIFVDRQGQPRVLDFGLARPLAPDPADPDAVSVTQAGEFVGTFAYAAPEQFRAPASLMDVRADVYSLGVILYELFAGRRPYELTDSIATIIATIQNTIPSAPSKVGASTDRDLDTITMRALAKERERRYGSAADLARDLQYWADGWPIEARRDSTFYVLRKNLQRHWIVSASVALIVGVSVSAALVSDHFRGLARAEARRAQEQSQKAERKSQESLRVRDLLESLITANDPERAQGSDPTVREVLDRAGPEILARLQDEPLVRAELLLTIGRAHLSLHDPKRAEAGIEEALEIFERLHGPAHPDTLSALVAKVIRLLQQADYRGAWTLARGGLERLEGGPFENSQRAADLWEFASRAALGFTDLPEAIETAEVSLEIQETLPDPDPIARARAQAHLALLRGYHDELGPAETMMSAALVTLREQQGAHPTPLIQTLVQAQELARLRRGYSESAQLLAEAHALSSLLYGAEDSYTLRIELGWLDARWRATDFRPDAPEVQQALDREELLLTRTDPNAMEALTTLANFAASTGDDVHAVRLARHVVDACDARGAPDDRVLVGATSVLGSSLALQQRYKEAEPILRRAMDLGDSLLGAEDRKKTHKTAALLAVCQFMRLDGNGLAELVERSLAGLKPGVTELPDLLLGEARVAQFLMVCGHDDLAERLGRHVIERLLEKRPEGRTGLAEAGNHVAQVLRERGHLDEALDLAHLAAAAAEESTSEFAEFWLANNLQEIGTNLRYQEQYEEAEENLIRSLELYDEMNLGENTWRLGALRSLAAVRLNNDDAEGAIPLLEELVQVYRRRPPETRVLGELLSHLGQAYADEDRLEEAEETLIEADRLLSRTASDDEEWVKGTREVLREVQGRRASE